MALYRHRFGGTCASGDMFVFSWWSTGTVSVDSANATAVQWANTLWGGPGGTDGYASLITPEVVLTNVSTGTVNQSTGKQQQLAEATVNLPGIATGSAQPADVAIVVTLRTILANRSGRGRFYLPQPAASTLTSTGRMGSAAQNTVLDAAVAAWTASASGGIDPVVYSRTYNYTNTISTLGVGDLFDTQRRRENALNESRVTAPMP